MNSQSNSATAAKHQDHDHQHKKKKTMPLLETFRRNTNKKNKSFPFLKMQGLVCVERSPAAVVVLHRSSPRKR